MIDIVTDAKYFTRAVTELGDRRPVLTTQPIFNDRGVKILEKNVPVTGSLYDRLLAHALSAPIEDSLASADTVTGAVLRAHAEHALRALPFLGRICADTRTRTVLLGAIEKIPLPQPLAFQLTVAREVRPELFQHSIYTAITAAWLTLDPLVSRFDINLAAAAGLLHDLGMLHLDPVLFTPQNDIGRDQRRQLYSHPLVSVALIERHHEYPRELLRAVTEHHEFLDGSGYPRNLGAQAISPLGRILSLSELITTALAAGRETSELRLWVLLRMNHHRYDAALIDRVTPLLKPQSERPGQGLALISDPVGHLLEVDAVLSDWPATRLSNPVLDPQRGDGMTAVAAQVAQLRRTLAAVGAAPQQLAQLGPDALDDLLRSELALTTQEAAWQLRALTRQARRRWHGEADDRYPDALQAWLDRSDELVRRIAPGPAAIKA